MPWEQKEIFKHWIHPFCTFCHGGQSVMLSCWPAGLIVRSPINICWYTRCTTIRWIRKIFFPPKWILWICKQRLRQKKFYQPVKCWTSTIIKINNTNCNKRILKSHASSIRTCYNCSLHIVVDSNSTINILHIKQSDNLKIFLRKAPTGNVYFFKGRLIPQTQWSTQYSSLALEPSFAETQAGYT